MYSSIRSTNVSKEFEPIRPYEVWLAIKKLECLPEYVHVCTVVEDVQIELLAFSLRVCLLGLYSSWFIPQFY